LIQTALRRAARNRFTDGGSISLIRALSEPCYVPDTRLLLRLFLLRESAPSY
jgi:hypothetical protein